MPYVAPTLVTIKPTGLVILIKSPSLIPFSAAAFAFIYAGFAWANSFSHLILVVLLCVCTFNLNVVRTISSGFSLELPSLFQCHGWALNTGRGLKPYFSYSPAWRCIFPVAGSSLP